MNGRSCVEQGFYKASIELSGSEQGLDQRLLAGSECGVSIGASLCEHLADQAEAVAVNAATGNAQNAIARADLPTVDQVLLFNNGHAEAC